MDIRRLIETITKELRKPIQNRFPVFKTLTDMKQFIESLGGIVEESESKENMEFVLEGGTYTTLYKLSDDESPLFKIVVYKYAKENEKIYSISHSLGHLVLNHNFFTNWEDTNIGQLKHQFNYDKNELIIIRFSLCLLMPDTEFIKAYRLTDGDFYKLRDYFNVPSKVLDLKLNILENENMI